MATFEVTQTVRKHVKRTTTEENFYEDDDDVVHPRPSSRMSQPTSTKFGQQTLSGRQTPVRPTTPGFIGDEDEEFARMSSSRHQKLRDALFPEGDVQVEPQSGRISAASGHLTAVQRLSEPAQNFKHVVNNLINYQEDCDTAQKAAPELVRLLNHSDPNTRHRALYVILQLSRKHASRYGLASSEDLVRKLIQLLESLQEDDVTEMTLNCLYHLSGCEQGADTIVRFLTIPLLVRLLSHSVAKISSYSLSILHNILLLVEGSKPIVRQCEGVQRMCELLAHPNVKVLAILVDCLHLLAFNDPETKLVILSNEGPHQLVKIMRTYTYEKLLFVASRLLKVLSVCAENKPVIVTCGGVQALAPHLESQSPRLMLSCLWTLRNLSDQAYHLTEVDALIFSLIQLLSSSNDHVATCAAGCLCNFTCQNPHNKRVLVKARGVEALCRTLKQYLDREEVTEPVCCALRHVTHLHDLSESALMLCLQYEGVQCVARLLLDMHQLVTGGIESDRSSYPKYLTAFSWPLLKAILGLITNMARHEESRRVLRDLGVVPVLCNSLLRAYTGAQEIAQQRGSVVSMQSELSYVDGVRLEDMCELALAALQVFSRDPNSRRVIMLSSDLLSINVQILYHSSEYLQRAATSLLCELALESHGAKMIEQEGATSRLTQLLHSPDKAVAAYSAVCLYRLAQDKPEEYRKRLIDELNESLKDAGLARAEDVHLAVQEKYYPANGGYASSPIMSNGRAGSTAPLVVTGNSSPNRSYHTGTYGNRGMDHTIQYSASRPGQSSMDYNNGGQINLAYNSTYDMVDEPRRFNEFYVADVDV